MGAQEIDMVINIGALIEADYKTVLNDIRDVVEAAKPAQVKVKLAVHLQNLILISAGHYGKFDAHQRTTYRRLYTCSRSRSCICEDVHRIRRWWSNS